MAGNRLRRRGFDVSICTFGTTLGVAILLVDNLSTTFPTISPYDLGPGAVPNVVAILMIALSAVLFIQTWRTPVASASPSASTDAARADGAEGDEGASPAHELRHLVLLALLFSAYVLGIWAIGFIVSTVAFLLVFYRALGSRNWLKNIVIAVAFTISLYYVFTQLFTVPIPARLLTNLIG